MGIVDTVLLDLTLLEKVKKIINFGHVYAAGSMTKFTGEQIFSDIPKIHNNDLNKNDIESSYLGLNEDIYLLSTDLIGSVSCKSYLILKESEALKLVDVIQKNVGLSGLPKEEILKELDNILAAGVTTCMSNQMNCNVYGGVPVLRKVSGEELYATIAEDVSSLDFDLEDFDFFVTSKTKFLFTSLGIKPEFLWVMPDEFIMEIK